MGTKITHGSMLNNSTLERLIKAAADVMNVDPLKIKSKSRKRETGYCQEYGNSLSTEQQSNLHRDRELSTPRSQYRHSQYATA